MPSIEPDGSESDRLVTALVKIGLALRTEAQRGATAEGLTPLQTQTLAYLLAHQGTEVRLTALAKALGVTPATTSESVETLTRKGLVTKSRSIRDGRAVNVVLTDVGVAEAQRSAGWTDFLLESTQVLSHDERSVFLRGLLKMLRSLQLQGRIPVSRMCVTCRFFRPNIYADPKQPHHCAFADAPFGDGELRVECADQEPATSELSDEIWEMFTLATPAFRKET